MTFTEAALEVLEREGRALHAREIAERAVQWGLLSHVGKTPVQTMSARISTVVAKGPDRSPFVRVSPGVFALASWKGVSPGPRKAAPATRTVQQAAGAEAGTAEAAPKKRRRRRRKPKQEQAAEKQTQPVPAAEKGPPARRDKPKAAPPKAASPKTAPPKAASPKAASPKATPPKAAPPPAPEPKAAEGAGRIQRVGNGDPADVAERAVEVLRGHSAPLAPDGLAKAIGWKGDRATLLLDALLTAEGLDRELRGLRPRFVRHRSGWALAEREVSSEIVELERQVSEAADRLTQLAARQIQRRLRSLPLKALVRVVIMYLRRQGFDSMNPVERGGSEEFHLSVLDRRGGGQFRTAVVIRRDAADKPVPDRAVSELRGALHHYRSMNALIVTTGTFVDQARAEAIVANMPPVALIDGETLARELARVSIGVRVRKVGLPSFDEAFFGALGA